MKHLHTYKLFESKLIEIDHELQGIIYDISHELRDNNYAVSYQWQVNIDNAPYMTIRSDIEGKYPNSTIVPRDRARLINKEEVDDVVNRIKDVCRDYGWLIDVWEGEYEYILYLCHYSLL